jgi:hypothetical protein
MRSMALVVLALAGLAWSRSKESLDRGTVDGAQLRYGTAIQLGKGEARTYVVRDQNTGDPVEVGVALTEGALQGLPEAGHHGGNGHEHYSSYILELPDDHGTPYRFVELDWNPRGHGGPYTAQHFDFHFYRVPLEEHDAIDPARSDYAERAAAFPAAEELPAGYVSSHLLMNLPPRRPRSRRWGCTGSTPTRPSFRPGTSRSPRPSSSDRGVGR